MTRTAEILDRTLQIIRRDGWKPNGWGIVPPWCLRRALTEAVNERVHTPMERNKAHAAARAALAKAIGQPLGLISNWEGDGTNSRTQADVEKLLLKAIEES